MKAASRGLSAPLALLTVTGCLAVTRDVGETRFQPDAPMPIEGCG